MAHSAGAEMIDRRTPKVAQKKQIWPRPRILLGFRNETDSVNRIAGKKETVEKAMSLNKNGWLVQAHVSNASNAGFPASFYFPCSLEEEFVKEFV
jgi:hypothetical protein